MIREFLRLGKMINSTRHKQRGFVAATALVATLSIVAAIYFSFAYSVSVKARNRLDERRNEWIQETQKQLSAWYLRNANTIEANTAAIPVSSILSGAGINIDFGAQVASTAQLSANGISYHSVAIWLPADGATGTGLNMVNGSFNVGTMPNGTPAPTKYALANGLMIETATYVGTLKKMRRDASKLEAYFNARFLSDPNGDAAENYYRAADCMNPIDGQLPCIDTYTPLASSGIMSTVGFSPDDAVDGWGNPVSVSNLAGVPAGQIAISLVSTTPWGSQIQILGVRP